MARRFDVGGMARRLRAAVNSEVFRGGDRFEILWIAALQTGDEGDAHARSQIRIFAISFLAAAPTGIAKNIDVGRPDGKAPIPVGGAVWMQGGVILGAEFRADNIRGLAHKRLIESCRHANRLRKYGGDAGPGYAMKALVPPIVFRNMEPRNRCSGMAELRGLFFERHTRDEIVDTLFDGQLWVEISCAGRRLLG